MSDDQLTVVEYKQKMTFYLSEVIVGVYNSLENLLKMYFIMTICCVIGDLADFIIQAVRFGRVNEGFSALALLTTTMVFLLCDVYYILWIAHVQMKLPP